jgi:hypothetical protein
MGLGIYFCVSFYAVRVRLKLFLEREGIRAGLGVYAVLFLVLLKLDLGEKWKGESAFDVCQDPG